MLAIAFAVALTVAVSPALGIGKCSDPNRTVTMEPQQIFSPGYPDVYTNYLDCQWVLTADSSLMSGRIGIQIVAIKMDVNDDTGDCTSDYIEAIAVTTGDPPNTGRSLGRWCGNENKIIKTISDQIIIKFHSDGQSVGAGFILSYNLAVIGSSSCSHGTTTTINVNSPVYASIKGDPSAKVCRWLITSRDRQSRLIIELFKPSKTMHSMSRMILYEGPTTGVESFEWDPKERPFSKMYMSTHEATLVLTEVDADTADVDDVILKFFTMKTNSRTADCTRNTQATLDFSGAPVLFAMPFATDHRRTKVCPLELRNTDDKNIRLDVIGVKNAVLTCENEPVTVRSSNSSIVHRSCNRGKTPVYFHNESVMKITLPHQRTMFLMASSMDKTCNGHVQEIIAYRDVIQTEMFPKTDEYMNFAKCLIRVMANKNGDAVAAKITWQIPDSQDPSIYSNDQTCEGDYLNVYDGYSESTRLIASSCHQHDRRQRQMVAHVASTQRSLFIEFDADKMYVSHSLKIEFHSLPAASNCLGPVEILVGNGSQIINSPNYPEHYPLNQECDYILRSMDPRPDEDIVIKVINVKLPALCRDILTIYKGESMENDDIVDHVCAKDEGKVIRVEKALASMKFTSDDKMTHEGWSVEVYLERRNAAGGIKMEWQPLMAIVTFILAYLSLL